MKVKNTDYAYAVARIRANETRLLKSSDIESLIACRSLKEAESFLVSKGWVESSNEAFNLSDAIDKQNKRLWTLLCECVPNRQLLEVFTVQNDYYNIKAALKCIFANESAENYFAYPTSLDVEALKEASRTHYFNKLGDNFAKAANEAFEAACQTQSGQDAAIILDRAALSFMIEKAHQNGCEMVKKIADFICAAANIKIAVRCAKTGKSASFAKQAFSACNAFDVSELAALCEKGEKEVIAFLKKTEFSKGAQLIEQNAADFEKWCDDSVIEITKDAKFIFFGFEPICAYYYAKQNEIKTVRIIMSAKESGLSDDIIRQRARELYV